MDISSSRLISQKIEYSDFTTVKEIINWMAAMQAQDFDMAKWALGVRMKDPAKNIIESAIDSGEVLRIHVLRPTWHLVSADDIYWILRLNSNKIKSSLKSRHKELELTEKIIGITSGILEKSLSGGLNLTRNEIASAFHKAGIRTDQNRLSHIMFRAEMDELVCSGPSRENKSTYALLYERVPEKKEMPRDESLAELARRYFTSRCPATLEDFVWWSNLSVSDALKATDYLKPGFITETIDSKKYWIPYSYKSRNIEMYSVHILPAYDEFLISYRDRSSSLAHLHNKKIVSINGIFYPHIVVNGQVEGLWKRFLSRDKVIIEMKFFMQAPPTVKHLLNTKANLFGRFLNKTPEIL